MKITGIRTHYRYFGDRSWVLTEMQTDEEITGYSEVGKNRETAVVAMIRELEPFLIGKDPARIELLWEQIYRLNFWIGTTEMTALSAVEICMWDILGKSLNAPIYKLLGGPTREKVRLYAHDSPEGGEQTPEGFAAGARRRVEQGYTAIKTTVDHLGLAHSRGEKRAPWLRQVFRVWRRDRESSSSAVGAGSANSARTCPSASCAAGTATWMPRAAWYWRTSSRWRRSPVRSPKWSTTPVFLRGVPRAIGRCSAPTGRRDRTSVRDCRRPACASANWARRRSNYCARGSRWRKQCLTRCSGCDARRRRWYSRSGRRVAPRRKNVCRWKGGTSPRGRSGSAPRKSLWASMVPGPPRAPHGHCRKNPGCGGAGSAVSDRPGEWTVAEVRKEFEHPLPVPRGDREFLAELELRSTNVSGQG